MRPVQNPTWSIHVCLWGGWDHLQRLQGGPSHVPEPHLCVKAAVTTALPAIPPGIISKQIIISHKNGSQFKHRLHRLPATLYLDSVSPVGSSAHLPLQRGEETLKLCLENHFTSWNWLFKAVYWGRLTATVPTFNPPPPDAGPVIACFSISSCFFLFLSTASGFLTPLYVVWGEKKNRHMIRKEEGTLMSIFQADQHALLSDRWRKTFKARQQKGQSAARRGNGDKPRCSELNCDCGLEPSAFTGRS